jgi:5'-nucleotidase
MNQDSFRQKKFLKFIITGTLFISLLGFGRCDVKAAQDFKKHESLQISIAHVNDLHAHLDSTELKLSIKPEGHEKLDFFAQVGGYPRLKTKLDELRILAQQNHHAFLALNGGDVFQGSLYFTKFKGAEEAPLLKEMKFDAMVIGNHEFDLGNKPLRDFAIQSQIPLVAANLNKQSSAVLKDVETLSRYIIKDFNGERVGIFGIVLENTANISSPDIETLFLPEIETAQATVSELQDLGVNKIIMLSHIGLARDQMIAKSVSGIDLIVGSHSHTWLGELDDLNLDHSFTNHKNDEDDTYAQLIKNPEGEKTCLVQAGEGAKGYGHLELDLNEEGQVILCQGSLKLMVGNSFQREYQPKVKENLNLVDLKTVLDFIAKSLNIEIVSEDSQMRSFIDLNFLPSIKEMEAQVLAQIPQKLTHVRVPNPLPATLDPQVTESIFWKLNQLNYKVDFAVQNAGTTRADLNAGPLTFGYVMGTLLPFGNKIVALDIRGSELRNTLEFVINAATANGEDLVSTGSFPYVSHLRYTYNGKAEKGARITQLEQLIKINLAGEGEWVPIQDEQIYRMATNSYVAAGKDGYAGFLQSRSLPNGGNYFESGLAENEIFIEYVQTLGTLEALPYETIHYLSHL